jgi:acyl-CoA thioesterase-1
LRQPVNIKRYIELKADTKEAPAANKNILVFGDSLTAGYGLDDASEVIPQRIANQDRFGKAALYHHKRWLKRRNICRRQKPYRLAMKQHIDVFVLELGANDGLRGIPVKETEQNLQTIIDRVKAKYPKAKLVMLGMQVPPNMGDDLCKRF